MSKHNRERRRWKRCPCGNRSKAITYLAATGKATSLANCSWECLAKRFGMYTRLINT